LIILKDDDVFVPVREIFVKDKVRQRTADRLYRVYGEPAPTPDLWILPFGISREKTRAGKKCPE